MRWGRFSVGDVGCWMVGVDLVCVQVREIDAQCVVFSFGWNGSVHVSVNLIIDLAVFMAAEWLSLVFCRVGLGMSRMS